MAIPGLPDVRAAAWHHPFRFSGRLPFIALLLMVGVGLVTALIAGAGGYFGGAVTSWIVVQATHLSTVIVEVLHAWGYIGTGVGSFFIILPTFIVGFGYPMIIGGIAGGGVAIGAQIGKCRMPYLAGLLGFLAGGAAYAAFVGTTLYMQVPLHVSSRILPLLGPPLSYALMVLDCLIVLIMATLDLSAVYEAPFCESCRKWFSSSTKLTIPASDAAALVEALASRSVLPLQGVPDGTSAPARIQLDLSRCECGQSDHNLIAVLHWNEARKGKVESKTKNWFSTTVPASLGEELERRSTSTLLPPAAEQRAQTPTQQRGEEARPSTLEPQEATPLHPSERSQAAGVAATTATSAVVQPANQAPKTETCKRCGATIDSSANANYTCPYCGHTQWGTLIGCGTFSLALMVGAILWGSHIHASFWRLLIVWGGGVLGGIVLLVVIAWIIKGLRTPLKPLSEVTLTDLTSAASESAVKTATLPAGVPAAAGGPPSQAIVERGAAKPALVGPKVFEAPAPDPIQEIPIDKPVEIDWLSISNACRRGDYEELARILYTLDKRSDRQYASDKDAYSKTRDLIKEVGKQLDRKGGEELMKQVLVRAGSLGCNTRFIEGEWNGIGTWWG